MKTLYLFPDTNVFLQCKLLEEVEWSVLGDWDRIEVLLTRPVQTEIDALKRGGNARRVARARRASSLIRELLQGGQKTLRREQPLVELCLRHDLRRDEGAAGDLNYDERDDQLVGIALAFQKLNSDSAVWLLTNDTGPMASAKAVGLTFREVPEGWLLPPEVDEAQRRENELKAEIARYKSLEPSFEIEFAPFEEPRLRQMYRALSTGEIEELVSRLAKNFPLCSDFGPSEPQERVTQDSAGPFSFLRGREVFQPATSEEIDDYRQRYEKWKRECGDKLSKLSKALHALTAWPRLTVRVVNAGSRPAEDALVIVDVRGKIVLRPPKREDDDSDQRKQDHEGALRLSPPPTAPKGRWDRIDPSIASSFSQLKHLLAQPNEFRAMDRFSLTRPLRDANALYFKTGSPGMPSPRIEYECAQWRHQQPAEVFEFDVLCPLKPGDHSGIVRVTVHAANLTTPEVHEHPITLSVEESSCLEIAQRMVMALGA